MGQSTKSTSKNQVSILIDREYIKLQIPSVYARLYYDRKQAYISFGAKDTPQNRLLAEQARLNLIKDLESETFNPHEETRYQHPTKQEKLGLRYFYSGNLTLLDIWDKYCVYKKNSVSPETHKYIYRGKVLNMIKACPQDIHKQQEIRNFIVNNHKPTTAQRGLRYINACLKWSKKENIIPENFVSRFGDYLRDFNKSSALKNTSRPIPQKIKITRKNPEKKAWTKEEMEIIIDAFYNRKINSSFYQQIDHFGYLIEFLFRTGMRHGEAFALTWGDIKDDFSCIYINKSFNSQARRVKSTKTNTNRTLPCSPRVKEILRTVRPENCNLNDLVFKTSKNNHFSTRLIGRIWSSGCHKSSKSVLQRLIENGEILHYLHPYSTRKTFITLQLQAGFDVKTVADWVGDKPETILKHYASINETAIPVDL